VIQPPNKPVGVADTLNCTDELPVFARVMVWVLAAVLAKEAPACSSVTIHAKEAPACSRVVSHAKTAHCKPAKDRDAKDLQLKLEGHFSVKHFR